MEYKECLICKNRADHTHHLISGGTNGKRHLADEDNLTINLCYICHDTAHNKVGVMEKYKQIGQLIYEIRQMTMYGCDAEQARQRFMSRYGKNYIW